MSSFKKLTNTPSEASFDLGAELAQDKVSINTDAPAYPWRYEPVSFEEFVTSKDHMRFPKLSAKQLEAAWSVLPRDPKKTFDADLKQFLVLCALWGQGSGKDSIAALMACYVSYVLLCLKNPYQFLSGHDVPGEPVDLINVACNFEQASNVFFTKFKSRVQNWSWLRKNFRVRESQTDLDPALDKERAASKKVVVIYPTAVKFPNNIRAFSRHSLVKGAEGYNPIYWCFTGDTKVALLDGRNVPIKDLVDNGMFYVYSFDGKKVVPGLAYAVRKTQRNAAIVRVTLDNGEAIRCTGNHLFMLRDGSYKRADELVSGTSLMPLYRKISKKGCPGYEMMYQPLERKWHYTHREMYKLAKGKLKKGYLIHHKNFNPLDNRPFNLRQMTFKAHADLHKVTEKMKEVRSMQHRKWWADHPEQRLLHSRRHKGKVLSEKTKRLISKANSGRKRSKEVCRHLSDVLKGRVFTAKHRLNLRKAAAIVNADPARRRRISHALRGRVRTVEHCKNLSISKQREIAALTPEQYYKRFATRIGSKPSDVTRKRLSRAVRRRNSSLSAEERREMYGCIPWNKGLTKETDVRLKLLGEKTSHTKQVQFKNHKVVSVTKCGQEDVYDLTVYKYHNFALSSGVFVHNCLDEASDMNFDDADGLYKMLYNTANSRFPGKWIGAVLSVPRHRHDFTVHLYEEAAAGRLPKVFPSKGATWEVNPTKKYEDFKEELENPATRRDALSRLACEPPAQKEAFFEDVEKVKACVNPTRLQIAEFIPTKRKMPTGAEVIGKVLSRYLVPRYSDSIKCVAHVDLGHVNDRLAVAVAHADGPRVIFDLIIHWEADKENKIPIDIDDAAAVLIELKRNFLNLVICSWDQWNSISSQQRLNRANIVTIQKGNTFEDYKLWRQKTYEGNIEYPDYPTLTDPVFGEIVNLQLLNNEKVDHPKGGHNDISEACTGCVSRLFGTKKNVADAQSLEDHYQENEKDAMDSIWASESIGNEATEDPFSEGISGISVKLR